jgi:hypothetical protein
LKTLLLHTFFALLLSCARHGPMTTTKILISNISHLSASQTQYSLSGLSQDGQFFSLSFSGSNEREIELPQGRWQFYGIRIDSVDTPLCAHETADLVAEVQNIKIEYNEKNCEKSEFGNSQRYASSKNNSFLTKIYFCNNIPQNLKNDCDSEEPTDARGLKFTINDINLTKVANYTKSSSGVSSSCLTIDNLGKLNLPKNYIGLPMGWSKSLPLPISLTLYSDDECQNTYKSIESKKLFFVDNEDFYQTSTTNNSYLYFYKVPIASDQAPTEEIIILADIQKLKKGETCITNSQCESEACGHISKNGISKGGGTISFNESDYDLKCFGKLNNDSCEDHSDCESNRCVENSQGEKVCLKSSLPDYITFTESNISCLQNDDCSSGYCKIYNEDDPMGGACDIPSENGFFLELNSGDQTVADLNTKASINSSDHFSVSLWFKTTSKDPMLIISQRDNNNFNGAWNLGLNGAAPSFSGYRPAENYSAAIEGSINFSFYQNGAKNNNYTVIPNTNILDGNWHHLTASREFTEDVNILKIHVDGELIGSQSYSDTTLELNDSNNTYVGGNFRDTREYFHGGIDNFIIWNIPLSSNQVSALYTLGPTESIIANNDFSKTSITFETDLNDNIIFEGAYTFTANLPNDIPKTQDIDFTNNFNLSLMPFYINEETEIEVSFCYSDFDCSIINQSYVCDPNNYTCLLTNGEICNDHNECLSKNCDNGFCQKSIAKEYCILSSDCLSSYCSIDNPDSTYQCLNIPINDISFPNGNSGKDSTTVNVTLNHANGMAVNLYNDSDCITKIGSGFINKTDIEIAIRSLDPGINNIYAKYLEDPWISSGCVDLQETYTVE